MFLDCFQLPRGLHQERDRAFAVTFGTIDVGFLTFNSGEQRISGVAQV